MIEVTEVLLAVLVKDNDITEVHQTHPPTHPRQDDVRGTLEGGRRVRQTKRHARVSKGCCMNRQSRVRTISRREWLLSLTLHCVEYRRDLGVPDSVHVIFHVGEGVGLGDLGRVETRNST